MIRVGAADSPSVSSIFLCQALIYYQSVAKMLHIGDSYTKETTNISVWTIDRVPWDYTATDSGGGVYPYIYNIRKKVQV